MAKRVLERIRAAAPRPRRDSNGEKRPDEDSFGMPENAVRAVLEAYAVMGAIGLARRDGNVRYYDLLERLVPAEVLAHEVPERERLRRRLLSRYRAHGLLGPGGAGGTIARIADPPVGATNCETNWSSAESSCPSRSRACAASVSFSPRSCAARGVTGAAAFVAFIAPFDALLWDTALLASVFDFE